MEMKSRVKQTLCPHCQSTFEISDEDMQQAFGAVRCGECMKIFNAAYHLIDHTALPAETADTGLETPADQPDEQIPTLYGFQPETSAGRDSFPAFLIGAQPTKDEPEPEIMLPETSAPETRFFQQDEHPEEPASFKTTQHRDAEPDDDWSVPVTDTDDALMTEARPQTRPQKKTGNPLPRQFWPALLLLPLLAFGLYWLLGGQGNNLDNYQINDIRLAPASSPQQMEIHFQLGNTGNSNLPLPSLSIELLNLSAQPVATEHLTPDQISRNLAVLAPGSSHALTVTVNRPATFVQSARIQPLSP